MPGPKKSIQKKKSVRKKRRKGKSFVIPNPKFAIGNEVECKWSQDHQFRLCKIVSIRPKSYSSPTLYYVHYSDFNRRLDEWVTADRLRPVTGKVVGLSQKIKSSHCLTRGQKRSMEETLHIDKMKDTLDAESRRIEEEYEEHTKVKNISRVQYGSVLIDAWYFSPYPEEYGKNVDILYVCQFCLKYMKYPQTFLTHKRECDARHPPGNELYRHERISVWEVDGSEDKIYCQNLCLLAKLFLDHKTLYFDVDPFLFYIVTEYKESVGFEIVGYFSKEKNSPEAYNLACILTLPHHQRKGYGRFLISLSYEISRRDNKCGTPEKPLSDLGNISYKSYWIETVLRVLSDNTNPEITVHDISRMTCMVPDDVISALKEVKMIHHYKGQYIVTVKPMAIRQYLREWDERTRSRKATFVPEQLEYVPRALPAPVQSSGGGQRKRRRN